MHTTTSVNEQAQESRWPPLGWITKKVAAERLKISESRAAALTIGATDPLSGSIRSRIERDPSSRTGQRVSLFHEGDVERLIFERSNPQESKLPAKVDKPNPYEVSALSSFLQSAAVAKPWIPLDEAAAYSGLPKSLLLHLIRQRKLAAFDCGPRPGGRYRVKRSDLDALEGEKLCTNLS